MATSPAVAHAPSSPAQPARLVSQLGGWERWPDASAALVSKLGFRLVPPAVPDADDWHLLVALRDRPTLTHFDPELLAYYAPAPPGAERVSIDRTMHIDVARAPRSVLWGHVHVIDRIPVENRFLTFGGELRAEVVDASEIVLDLVSPAPIVRWGGHSQGTDDLAGAIGAFFGRLIVPVDFVPGAAERIDAVPPGVLYRAFLADALRRATAAERRGIERTPIGEWIAAAWHRARRDTDACDAAQRLLRELDLP